MKIYIVVQENETVEGAFTTEQRALDAIDFYKNESPSIIFHIIERRLDRITADDRDRSCAIVGCKRQMPHEHKIEGPAQNTNKE